MDAAVMESSVLQLIYSRGEKERGKWRRRRRDGVVDSQETTEKEKRFCQRQPRAYHNEACILICRVVSEV